MNDSTAGPDRRSRFDDIVAVYYPDMYRYAVWLCRDRAIADDVVQESLLRAWTALDSLKEDAAAKQWLLTIVRRENARWFERRHLETVDVDDLTPAQEAVIAESPNDAVADVRAAIFSLDDDYREPLVLQVLMGYSTKEIAELMELKQGAVLTRLHRARHKLRENVDFEAGGAGAVDER